MFYTEENGMRLHKISPFYNKNVCHLPDTNTITVFIVSMEYLYAFYD